ncbi:MAG: polysaccharide deacetylase family protein [Myxococcales bacterium]|nr:polysaccharide deacetylase family protein [Myxococcales bacterium]
MRSAALMYHRVCPRTPETACYFARGTAVEPSTFAAQMAWLAARAPVVAPSAWLRAEGTRPGVMLTFDDGYRDVVEHVAPVCARLGLPFAVFPIAGHLGDAPRCWVDEWYAIIHHARRRAGGAGLPLLAAGEIAPPIDDALRWWVRGPIKARLHLLDDAARTAALAALADALGVVIPAGARLYCDRAELRALAAAGHDIGGHGRWHRRLADCDAAARADELDGAAALLDALGVAAPRVYAYADGSHDPASVAAVGARFAAAFTVESGEFDAATDRLRLPRLIARDRPPSHPEGWAAFGGSLG